MVKYFHVALLGGLMEQGTNHGWKTKGNFILLGTFLALVLALMVIAVVHAHKSETLEHSQTTAGTSSTTTAPTTVPATPATVQTTLPTETEVTTAPTEITTLPTETEPTTVPTEPPETTEPTEPKPTYSSAGYGEYLNVGTTYIAEVITTSAETFNGKTTDDYTAPIRNFLPEGTVDYAFSETISNKVADYVLLRCGRRVYLEKDNTPGSKKTTVVKYYTGTLPDHNEIGFVSTTQEDHFTILTLDVMWKAPFYFDIAPQTYRDPSVRDYRISAFTAEYVDITFCYATVFEGTVELGDNPLFQRAEVTYSKYDCTLRLYLKETGGFYGYDTYYNENDQLCFKFLNPTPATETTENSYGADLSGIRIMIDVGHGGLDCGSLGTLPDGTQVEEADLNLNLAKILQQELETMGAAVILNRTTDSTIKVDDRVQKLRDAAPDICISIHQNAYAYSSGINGLQVCYSTPMSRDLAMLMYDRTVETGIYKNSTYSWHYYYVAKQTICPVALMECGYITNAEDLAGMLDEAVLLQKAQAMAKAVAEYFLKLG